MAFDLEQFDLSILTRRIELPEITQPGRPLVALVGMQAGEGNKRFRNELFKHRSARNEPPADALPADALMPTELVRPGADDLSTTGISVDGIDTVALYAASVLTGWEGVTEAGARVPFSPEMAEQFLRALVKHCPDVWIRVFLFFREDFRKAAPQVDPVDLGKE
jgi:hypothetical protein